MKLRVSDHGHRRTAQCALPATPYSRALRERLDSLSNTPARCADYAERSKCIQQRVLHSPSCEANNESRIASPSDQTECEHLCEHLFVTSQGSAHGRLTRAIQQRNLWAAESSLRELGAVSLEDALAYLDLLAEQKPEKLERACVRWHGRLET